MARLGSQAVVACPALEWHHIQGIGNWLRHQYDRVDMETVWNTIVNDLPAVKAGVMAALKIA